MLAGARAFTGDDITEIIAAVLKSTPDWTALPADVPPAVVTLIQRCLEKDRKTRIGDIAVARFLLSDQVTSGATFGHGPAPAAASAVASAGGSGAGGAAIASAAGTVGADASSPGSARGGRAAAAVSRGRQLLPWVLAAVLIGALAGWFLPRRTSVAAPLVTRLQMNVRPADRLVGSIASVRPSRTAMALSPDGRLVVFAATQGTALRLYARPLDREEATPVPGTEGGSAPFLSPDGAWIGFWVETDNTIRKVPIAGGPPTTICNTTPSVVRGATWAEDGTIYFADRNGLSKVSSAGGTPASVATPDTSKGERLLLPHALPGGRALLLTVVTSEWEAANVVLLSLDTGERRALIEGGADARYIRTGHLAYLKIGTLMAVPFDIGRQQLAGAAVALVDGVMQAVNAPNSADETGAGQFAVSASGTLLYVTGGITPPRNNVPVWVDRKGTAQPLAGVPSGSHVELRLSPDRHRIAVGIRPRTRRTTDLWVYDMERGSPTRVTFEGGTSPIWSPDGKRLVYGANTLHSIQADGSGKPERLLTGDFMQVPSSWAPNPTIAFLHRGRGGTFAISVLDTDGGDRTPKVFLESRFNLTHAELSPDGRWMAYVSTESGSPEVYVQAYPGPGEKIRISTACGTEPVWTPNGRELLYRSCNASQFFSVTIRSLSPFLADAPRLLFESKPGEYDSTAPVRCWDVSADGQRFLLLRVLESTDRPIGALHVVLNWAEELTRRVQ